MTYIVTARKWRPMVFEDVVGQTHVTTTLRNAIATNRLSHAYIFSGPRGVGKTTTARILAKAINCLKPKEFNPDNACELCLEITENRSVNVFEIDGASNRGVDEIRNLREAVRYGPAKGKYKVYIIDEVHMLTKEAFNALLKTLEEPPPHVLFIFATTEINKVPLTILSRCQRFEFRRISINQIIERLRYIAKEEKITIDDDALFIIAKKGDGSLRDAQSTFDQIISFCGNRITARQIIDMLNIVDEELFFRTIDIVKSKDVKSGLTLVDEIINQGMDIREFLSGLTEHLRNILIVRTTGETQLIETSEIYKKRFAENAQQFSENDLLRLLKIVSDTDAAIRWSQQPRFKLEIGLMQMIKMDSSVNINQLLEQVEELKKKLVGKTAETLSLTTQPVNGQMLHETVQGSARVLPPVQKHVQTVSDGRAPVQFSAREPEVSAPALSVTAASPVSAVVEEQAPMDLTMDASLGKWSSLIEEACKHRIALGTMLSETTLVGIKDNSLRIGCPDDFHFDALKRNRTFLTELAQKVYGAKVHLETILSKDLPSSSQRQHTHQFYQDSSSQKSDEAPQHPVIQALIQEFGAKQIDQ